MTTNATVIVAAEVEDEADELFVILFQSMVYLLSLYVAGDVICGKFLHVIPPLVGQIIIGMLLGPHGLAFVSSATAENTWPLLGEIGLVLLLCQAGLEMDFDILRQVGPRGALMALVGSVLPTTIGFLLAYFALHLEAASALAVGCSFGPTSAGIALNVLQHCGVLKTALGQLIVAIAIVDDIIALVVLSQLQALTADAVSASAIAVPIVSAFLWLFVGGAVALYAMPIVLTKMTNLEKMILDWQDKKNNIKDNNPPTLNVDEGEESKLQSTDDPLSVLDTLTLAHITILLFALLPATYYSQASHLLGAFLAGLSACQQSRATEKFNDELGKTIVWLIRIFFGASIAFVIPVQLFQDGTVIARGFLLSLALLGKIAMGPLLTPVHLGKGSRRKSRNRHRFDRQHMRDCFVVGFSMAGEAEFAMLVAGFGFSEGLLEEDIYASTVFAILISTIVSPCLLRLTLALFAVEEREEDEDGLANHRAGHEEILIAEDEEKDRQLGIEQEQEDEAQR